VISSRISPDLSYVAMLDGLTDNFLLLVAQLLIVRQFITRGNRSKIALNAFERIEM
jgi:hypothetical protein